MSDHFSDWTVAAIQRSDSPPVLFSPSYYRSSLTETDPAELRAPGGYLVWVLRKPDGRTQVHGCRVHQTVECSIPIREDLTSDSRMDTYDPPAEMTSRAPLEPFFPYAPSPSVYVGRDQAPKIVCLSMGLTMLTAEGGTVDEKPFGLDLFARPTRMPAGQFPGGSKASICMKMADGDVYFATASETADVSSSSTSSGTSQNGMSSMSSLSSSSTQSSTSEPVIDPGDTNLIVLTPEGVYISDKSFKSQELSPCQGDSTLGCKIGDARKPVAWAHDIGLERWRPIDLSAMDFDPTRPDIAAWEYARAGQFDLLTGKTFFLQPFSEAAGLYGKITVCLPTMTGSGGPARVLAYPVDYPVSVGGEIVNLRYALDMKLDQGRRRLWILDSGNGRVLRVNVDTGNADRVYRPQGTSALCSMALNPTTGVAYVRAIGRADSDVVAGESSSSSSTSTDHGAVYETIYAMEDDGMSVLVETTGRTEVDPRFLSPTDEFIAEIIASSTPIPLPTSKSMSFDPLRGNLWWLSMGGDQTVFMASISDLTLRSLYLGGSLDGVVSVTVDQHAGDAIVGGFHGNQGMAAVVDAACAEYVPHRIEDASKVNDVVMAEADDGCVLPFMVVGIAPPRADESSSSSSSDDTGNVFFIDNTRVADPEPDSSFSSSDVTGEAIMVTPEPTVNARIWSCGPDGTSSVRAWPLKNRKSGFAPSESVPAAATPRFSWEAKAFAGNPAFLAATRDGDIVKVEYSTASSSLSPVCGCTLPTGGAVLGISTVEGDGNVYVSGNGVLLRVDVDPTKPGEQSSEESSESSLSSQSGSSTPSEHFDWLEVPVAETTGATGIEGLSVQQHEKTGKLFLVSRQTGMVMIADSIGSWGTRTEYGPFQEPIEAEWSSHHSGILVAAKRGLHLVSVPSGAKRMLQGFVSHEVTDMEEYNGMVAVMVKADDGQGGLVKVLADDLSRDLVLHQTTGEYPSRACFLPTGKAIVSVERTSGGSKQTRFAIATLGDGTVDKFTDRYDGDVVSLFHDAGFDISFAVFSDGKVLILRLGGNGLAVSQAGKVLGGVSTAKGGLVAGISEGTFTQRAVRVFVGSRQGASDRWDSGVVVTRATTMLYGGGDNLSPGDRYWVTILVQDRNLGWSQPFAREFVAPIMQ